MSNAMPDSGMSYRDTQRYQRLLQKYAAMRPEQRAVVNTALADMAGASEQARAELQALQLARQMENQNRNLAMNQQAYDEQLALQNEKMDYQNQQDNTANALAAVGLGGQGMLGYMDGQAAKKRARRLDMLAGRYPVIGGGA